MFSLASPSSCRILLVVAVSALVVTGIAVAADTVFCITKPPYVVSMSPLNGAQNSAVTSELTFTFSKPVRRQILEASINPTAHGEWRFEEPLLKNHLFRKLVFVPALALEPETTYEVTLDRIRGFGLKKETAFHATFITTASESTYILPAPHEGGETEQPAAPTTKPPVTMLAIANDWQDQRLSCEAASLKMALASKDIQVSEDAIMQHIGAYDHMRQGDVWADPFETYVGDIDGRMCTTGYGVYWPPVAHAAQQWREGSEAFSGWSITDITSELAAGNPVIMWGTLPKEQLTDVHGIRLMGKK